MFIIESLIELAAVVLDKLFKFVKYLRSKKRARRRITDHFIYKYLMYVSISEMIIRTIGPAIHLIIYIQTENILYFNDF